MAQARLVLSMNLKNHALSQYMQFDFNSMVQWEGMAFGFNEDGIHQIDSGGSDGTGNPINSRVVFAESDLGSPTRKQLRKAFVSGRIEGDMVLSVKADGGMVRNAPVHEPGDSRAVPLRRDMAGEDFEIGIENVGGCDFDISLIDLVAIPLGPTRVRR